MFDFEKIGRQIADPFSIRPDDIDLGMIAAALAKTCRFGGRLPTFYSVAEHSVLLSNHFGPADFGERMADHSDPRGEWGRRVTESQKLFARWALLHDAAEAWLGDIARPLKKGLGWTVPTTGTMYDFAELERHILKQVARRFGLPWPIPEAVILADDRMQATEIAHFYPGHATTEPTLNVTISPRSWIAAEQMFRFTAEKVGLVDADFAVVAKSPYGFCNYVDG